MSHYEALTLFTADSCRVRDDLPPTPEPYQKVIGMQVGQRQLWLPEHSIAPNSLSCSVPRVLGRRLLWYFNRYYCQNTYHENPDLARNCLHFGLWMTRGIAHASRREASAYYYAEARHTPELTTAPQPGECTTIRSVQDLPEEPVLHAVVALDTDDHHVQVMTRGGDLGVTTLEAGIRYRTSTAFRDQVVSRRLNIDPTEWDARLYASPHTLQPDYRACIDP